MNIYRFLNSRDIKKYLEDIKYEFNSLEASLLVHQCLNASLKEKHKAWTWIIKNMPDMEVPAQNWCIHRHSLHDTLRKYMAMDDDLIKRFCSADDGIFTVGRSRCGCDVCYGYDENWINHVLYSFDECIKAVNEILYDYEDPDRAIADIDSDILCSSKYWYDNSETATRHFKEGNYKIVVTYGPGCSVKDVFYYGWDRRTRNSDYMNLLSAFFGGLWFDFPTPFKKGDIVHMVYDEPEGSAAFWSGHGAFVLEDILSRQLFKENKERYQEIIDNGGKTDMVAQGIFLQEDGTIYRECADNYMNLEFYHGPYEGMRRLLTPLSSYIKGDIDFEILLYSYRLIVMEENMKDFKQGSILFTDKKKKLAGLLGD